MRARRLATFGCVAVLLLGVGCRDRSTPQDKEDTLCVQLGKLDQSITQLASVAASGGNPAQVATLRAQMASKYKDVQAAAKKATALQLGNVTKAYNEVVTASASANTPEALAAAQPKIDMAASDFAAARLDLYNNAGCS